MKKGISPGFRAASGATIAIAWGAASAQEVTLKVHHFLAPGAAVKAQELVKFHSEGWSG